LKKACDEIPFVENIDIRNDYPVQKNLNSGLAFNKKVQEFQSKNGQAVESTNCKEIFVESGREAKNAIKKVRSLIFGS
jgi:hypothetical protein